MSYRKTRSDIITRSENDGCITPLLVDEKRANEEEKTASKLIPLIWRPAFFFLLPPSVARFPLPPLAYFFFRIPIQDA